MKNQLLIKLDLSVCINHTLFVDHKLSYLELAEPNCFDEEGEWKNQERKGAIIESYPFKSATDFFYTFNPSLLALLVAPTSTVKWIEYPLRAHGNSVFCWFKSALKKKKMFFHPRVTKTVRRQRAHCLSHLV